VTGRLEADVRLHGADDAIVDTKRERVTAYRIEGRQYRRTDVAREDDARLSTPLLPDLATSMNDLFNIPPRGRR
jgi:hypothetical protein